MIPPSFRPLLTDNFGLNSPRTNFNSYIPWSNSNYLLCRCRFCSYSPLNLIFFKSHLLIIFESLCGVLLNIDADARGGHISEAGFGGIRVLEWRPQHLILTELALRSFLHWIDIDSRVIVVFVLVEFNCLSSLHGALIIFCMELLIASLAFNIVSF